jgi:hypothetical protein
MKGIFKIEQYLEDTQQIVVRFCRLHDTKLITEYPTIAINIKNLDTYNCEFFIKSLMMQAGTHITMQQEKLEHTINTVESIDGNMKLDIQSLVGRNIECKLENYRDSLLKMRRVEL